MVSRTFFLFICLSGYVAAVPTTTLSPDEEKCAKYSNGSCSDCVAQSNCYYCQTNDGCYFYQYDHLVVSFSQCSLSSARWKNCWLNVEAMLIACGVLGFFLLVGLTCCCCWCSRKCKERRVRKMEREDREMDRREEERHARHEVQTAQRRARNDDIRAKYGLTRNNPPYRPIDDEGTN